MRKLPFSYADSRFDREMRFIEITWNKLVATLGKPRRTDDLYVDYLTWDREKQTESKDAGYYIIGQFDANLRHNSKFKRRGSITLDIDYPGDEFEARLGRAFAGYEFFWHTSRKSSPESPRIRVHFPLRSDVLDADAYEGLARLLASWYDIERVDRVSYVPAQMMFMPTVCRDGVFESGRHRGEWMDPEAELARGYFDYRDRGEWPRTAGEVPPEQRREKADSPLRKPGVIGAFNRAFAITRVLEEIIPGVYEPSGQDHRWRYHAAEGGTGAVIYDNDTALYSHHTNHDPGAGRSLNAFDVARIHKFGKLDPEHINGTPPTQLESFKAMAGFAVSLPDVLKELSIDEAFADISDVLDDSGDDKDEEGARQVEAAVAPGGSGLSTLPVRPEERSTVAPGAIVRHEPDSRVGKGRGEGTVRSGGLTDRQAELGNTPWEPLRDSLADPDSLDDPAGAAQGRMAGARSALRAVLTDCVVPDELEDLILPRIVAAGFSPSIEDLLLGELSDRHAELTGRRLSLLALKKTAKAIRARLVGETGVRKHRVPNVLFDDEGAVANTVSNMEAWLSGGGAGFRLGYDHFTACPCVTMDGRNWRPLEDKDIPRIRTLMEQDGFKTFGGGNDLVKQAVELESYNHEFDSAQLWLQRQIWDGVPRIGRFFQECFGADDSEYVSACGRYLFSALAGRVVSPGCQADMMPILFSRKQGRGKSSSVALIAPDMDFFGEIGFNEKEDDRGRKMAGKLIVEIAELKGLAGANLEAVKSFISRRVDEWIPKFKERSKKFPRRLIFMGTTNKQEFLDDDSGNRRFLPVGVRASDRAKIVAWREQLWAEGLEHFMALGHVDFACEDMAEDAHRQHEVRDDRESLIVAWLDAAPVAEGLGELDDEVSVEPLTRGDMPFTGADIYAGALKGNVDKFNRAEQMAMAKILHRLGYVNNDKWIDGRTRRVWVKVLKV